MNGAARSLELGLIGNCEIAALLDSEATIVWSCLPRLDGDPVFCALLEPDQPQPAGLFAIELPARTSVTQEYRRNTAMLVTTMADDSGNRLRIIDFCPRFRARGRMFRPAMIVRLVEPLHGRPMLRIRLRPLCEHGARAPRCTRGSSHISWQAPDFALRLTTNGSINAILDESPLAVDGPLALILGPDQTIEESPVALASAFRRETELYWTDWVRGLAIPYEWQAAVIRAAIALKLCTYEDTGAVLAALTTSLPESADSGRNWDYRYCWLRDSYFVIQALNRLGATRTMEGYLRFIDQIVTRCADREIAPLYSLAGNDQAPEGAVPSLRGYRGMGPVRIGNHAHLQRQNDVYGAIILAAAHSFHDERMGSPGTAADLQRLECLGERAIAVHDQPDAGPWEFRGFQQVHTFSAAMCWAGVDRLARIARRLRLDQRASYWRAQADALRARVLARAWNPRLGCFTSAYDGSDLDATALLLPELGLLEATDPRFQQTLAAIEVRLRDGDWLYRYRHGDDFGHPATAFTICAFWYVKALALAGRRAEAREHFERLLAARTRLGLLSEDIDPATGEWWGNFPQTYSLVGIINSALSLSRPWEDAP